EAEPRAVDDVVSADEDRRAGPELRVKQDQKFVVLGGGKVLKEVDDDGGVEVAGDLVGAVGVGEQELNVAHVRRRTGQDLPGPLDHVGRGVGGDNGLGDLGD